MIIYTTLVHYNHVHVKTSMTLFVCHDSLCVNDICCALRAFMHPIQISFSWHITQLELQSSCLTGFIHDLHVIHDMTCSHIPIFTLHAPGTSSSGRDTYYHWKWFLWQRLCLLLESCGDCHFKTGPAIMISRSHCIPFENSPDISSFNI